MRRMNRWRAPRWIRYWMIAPHGWATAGSGTRWAQCLWSTADRKSLPPLARPDPRQSLGSSYSAAKAVEPTPTACQLEPHCWSRVLPPDNSPFHRHTMTAFSIALVVSYFYPALEGRYFSWRSASRCPASCWHALPQRCARRNRAGHSVGLRSHNRARFLRLA